MNSKRNVLREQSAATYANTPKLYPKKSTKATEAACIAGKSDEEIRALVLKLESASKTADRQAPQLGVHK